MFTIIVVLSMAQPDCDGWFKRFFYIECASSAGDYGKIYTDKPGSRSSDREDAAGGDIPTGIGLSTSGSSVAQQASAGKQHTNRGIGTGSRTHKGKP